MLMPEKIKHKTAVIKNNLNPVWEEVFVFHKVRTKFIYDKSILGHILMYWKSPMMLIQHSVKVWLAVQHTVKSAVS